MLTVSRNLWCVLVLAASVACTASPDAGYEAVLVQKPLFVGVGGVLGTPVQTGRQYIAWTTTAVYVSMQPQRIDVQFDDLMTSDGVPIDFHAVVTVAVTDSVKLVKDFGAEITESVPGFWLRNLDQPFRTAVRDSVKRRGMNEMAITATAAVEVDTEVTMHLLELVKETGVPVRVVDVSLGRANPPDAIKNQRVETAAQEQRQNTEKQRKLAEDQRKAAEESRAAADNAYRQAMSLTPEQYLRLETIKMQREVCTGGKCTFLLGSGVVPTLDVR